VNILDSEATEDRGENARMASFVGAIAIADLVKSTLGPKGMDKLLVSMENGGESIVTNDGATVTLTFLNLKRTRKHSPFSFFLFFFFFFFFPLS
jgi:chaperonin GroEL (HSP60 family)